MARSKTKTAESTDAPAADDTGYDVFDEVTDQRQKEETTRQAAAVVQQVAASTEMPPEQSATNLIANPSSTRREPSRADGYAATVKKKEYKPLPDPFGTTTAALSNDPDGPKARILRSNENEAMLIQFSENPGEEIRGKLKEAGLHWEPRAHSDFAKGAWVIALDEGREWRNHTHAEEVFKDVVNMIRERNGLEPFISGAAQSAG